MIRTIESSVVKLRTLDRMSSIGLEDVSLIVIGIVRNLRALTFLNSNDLILLPCFCEGSIVTRQNPFLSFSSPKSILSRLPE